jgi:hypothetical protein
MHDTQDLVIRRLFAEQDENLPADDFMLKLGKRIDRQKRARRLYRVLAILACLVVSVACAPWAAQGMSNLIELTATGLTDLGPLLFHPLTLFLVGATIIGCSPVIYLWRTGRW